MLEHDRFFLDKAELVTLTGRKLKSKQIEQLRRMLIPFHINALGEPVVVRAALLPTPRLVEEQPKGWEPGVLRR